MDGRQDFRVIHCESSRAGESPSWLRHRILILTCEGSSPSSPGEEREKYLDWLVDLEWNKIGIPKPDLVFFLDIPFEFSQKLMKDRKNKITGEKIKDIHEQDVEYLKNAYNIAKELAEMYKWHVVDCVENEKLKSIEEINFIIYFNIK